MCIRDRYAPVKDFMVNICCSGFLGYIRVCYAYIADVSFRNPGTYSRRTDVDLTTLRVLYLPSLVIFAVGGLGCGGECVVATCCLLICELSVRNFQVIANLVY